MFKGEVFQLLKNLFCVLKSIHKTLFSLQLKIVTFLNIINNKKKSHVDLSSTATRVLQEHSSSAEEI